MKKTIKIILIAIISIILLCVILGIVDYIRANNGKKPIFILISADVYSESRLIAIEYYGLGYKIVICDKCIDRVTFMPLYFGSYAWFIDSDDITSFKITKAKECDNKAKLYYTEENRKIYTYCLDKIELEKNNENISLKTYLWEDPNVIDKIITEFTDNNTNSYDDGGTILYKGADFNLLKCHTIDGNNDIYIGDKNMGYFNSFCDNK